MSKFAGQPRTFHYHEIAEGMTEQLDYVISEEIYQGFLSAFRDYNPIHVDGAYAIASGYPGPVMHGAILTGFLSHFIGMHFPGRLSLLLGVDIRFAKPNYLGDRITLGVIVRQKMDAGHVVVLDATFTNKDRGYLAARARTQVMLRENP
jgi:3-hydroxybutyryl-CoA dehydratase